MLLRSAMAFHLRFLCLLIVFAGNAVKAQQCTGPGEPVAVIDFGAEGKPFPTAGKLGPTYATTTETCTPERTIALRPHAFFCNPDWVVLPGDHTAGDDNGNFLMVNAQEGSSEIFRDTVAGLCPGTIFYVEAWVINLLSANACGGSGGKPDLLFELFDLEGNKLAQQESGAMAPTIQAQWVPVQFRFVCPSNGKVVVNISSRNGVSCGSEFGIDDISFSPCNRPVHISVQGAGSEELKVCEESQKNYLLQANLSGFNRPVVQWQENANGGGWQNIDGANGSTYLRQPTKWGVYNYRVVIAENGNRGCSFTSDVTEIVIYPQPFAQGTNYVFGCYGFPFKFQGAGGNKYEWTGPSGFHSTEQAPTIPKLEFHHAGWYTVKVTTSAGCVGYDSTDLVVHDAPVGRINIKDTALCLGDSVQLQAEGSVRYRWLPATGLSSDTIANPIARPEKTTSYSVYIFKEQTCYDTAQVTIRVLERPAAFAGPDRYALKNRPVQLEGRVSGDGRLSFRWSPADKLNNPNILRPQARISETTLFRLEATAGNGCGTVYDEVKIEVVDGLYIPTAFTPNADFLNDVWEIIGLEDFPDATVRVFNRWGQEVYFSTARNYKPWDGKQNKEAAPPGTYIYLLDLKNGSALRKGTLTILK